MKQRIYVYLGLLAITCIIASCGNDEPEPDENCEGALCPYIGNWQLAELRMDGTQADVDLSSYRLNLMSPEDDPSTADFTRNYGDGHTDSGTWTVTNNNDVIVLMVGGEEEEYIVEESGAFQLILILHRENDKPGFSEFRYVYNK